VRPGGVATTSPLAAQSTLGDGVPEQGTAPASPITTTTPNEVVFVLTENDGGVTTIVPGNPFIELAPFTGDDTAYAILPDPGTYSAVWDVYMSSIHNYCTSVAAFYAAP
jgi:hypothetical protein